MDERNVAKEILKNIGGAKNVSHLEHCSTRLRFTLVDDSKVDAEAIKSIPGVLGITQTAQTQVIIGGAVVEVYREVEKLLSGIELDKGEGSKKKQKWQTIVLDFIISIFQPLIPAIAGGGILKSLLMLLNLLGLLDKATPTYQILTFVGDAPLYFLPLLVAITTANKLKVNSLVAVSAVGALLLPGLTTLITEGTNLAGITIQNINYAYQVFPAILCVISYSFLEKFFTKISPKVIRSFFVPMMSLLIVVPLTLLLLGPIGFTFGQGFASLIMAVFSRFGWIAVALLAAFLPFMVVTGMHKAMIPYVITSLGETGKELIYNAASLAHNIAEAGACFAVTIRSKDKGLKATAVSAGISALFGITEPALYGVTILHRRVLYGVMFGSLIGGATLGLLSVEAYVAVGPGIASLSMFISETLPSNLMYAIIGLVVSFIASFVAVMILWKEPANDEKKENIKSNDLIFNAPVEGKVIPLSKVNDDVFASKMLGDGVAIIPTKGELYAPITGTVTMIYNTKHALGMQTDEGIEILFHIGLETVNLSGQYFESSVREGQEVNQGEVLIKFDLEGIQKAGFDPTTMIVITEPKNVTLNIVEEVKVTKEEKLFIIEGMEEDAIA
ncbi:beta-glucoside-specific PTS transporter subunit IIABC [Candidatus Enterococcus willemsii]|uniref:PTS beta-glucoside transporter subunit EIIBCA n=1 Tax=Candidatus Enterococcus willemsii TaxID=1857215 RepID=A0ABQ6YX45_9ENTE|nr:beta-glucoside-specific PTS transporter subunit IIABC [Enterococcus sp. CU12B]KAF1302384.1 PTS beta-glucoside transporter subunit EIIBCA [Enterococcus sp. CU12B]